MDLEFSFIAAIDFSCLQDKVRISCILISTSCSVFRISYVFTPRVFESFNLCIIRGLFLMSDRLSLGINIILGL